LGGDEVASGDEMDWWDCGENEPVCRSDGELGAVGEEKGDLGYLRSDVAHDEFRRSAVGAESQLRAAEHGIAVDHVAAAVLGCVVADIHAASSVGGGADEQLCGRAGRGSDAQQLVGFAARRCGPPVHVAEGLTEGDDPAVLVIGDKPRR